MQLSGSATGRLLSKSLVRDPQLNFKGKDYLSYRQIGYYFRQIVRMQVSKYPIEAYGGKKNKLPGAKGLVFAPGSRKKRLLGAKGLVFAPGGFWGRG